MVVTDLIIFFSPGSWYHAMQNKTLVFPFDRRNLHAVNKIIICFIHSYWLLILLRVLMPYLILSKSLFCTQAGRLIWRRFREFFYQLSNATHCRCPMMDVKSFSPLQCPRHIMFEQSVGLLFTIHALALAISQGEYEFSSVAQ